MGAKSKMTKCDMGEGVKTIVFLSGILFQGPRRVSNKVDLRKQVECVKIKKRISLLVMNKKWQIQ